MAINPHDDYEKLAKLLYPSIEASGNVYYGQTRKLTMDEVLDKNDLGFESHVETEREYSYTSSYPHIPVYQYHSYFKWKLGPLYGSIPFNVENSDCTFKSFPSERYATVLSLYSDEPNYILWPTDSYIESEGISSDYINENFPAADFRSDNLYGSVFIKYKLVFEEKRVNNTINSGQYNTYEQSVSCDYIGLYVSYNCSPIDKDDYHVEDRNFYIYHDDVTGEWYLYIQVYNNYNGFYDNKLLPIKQPLTITAISDTATVAITDQGNIASKCSFSYKLSTSQSDAWQPYTYNTAIHFNRDESIQFRLESITLSTGLLTNHWPYSDQNYIQIIFGQNDTVEASGDIRSLLYAIFNNNVYNMMFNEVPPPYLFYRLFYNDSQLVKAPKLSLCKVGSRTYMEMFYGTSIVESPKLLPINNHYTSVYQSMFENCHSLIKAPVIYSSSPSMMHYNMLKGCDNITYIDASYLKDYDYDSSVYGLTIADSLPTAGTFVYPDNKQNPAHTYGQELFVGIDDWDFVKSETLKENIIRNGNSPVNAKYNSNCVTVYGSDNSDNGRGSVLDESTLNNMEKSFDENDAHRMNTYNKDGSYNQEIWGYKSFNSPVQFRNGIYDEFVSQIAYVTHTSDNEYSVAGSSIKLNSKDPNTDKTSKLILGTIEDIGMEYNCYNGTGTCIISGDCDNMLPGISSHTPDSSSAYSTVGTFYGKYTGYTYNSSYTGYIPEYIYDACRCEIASTYKDVCYSIIESETYYTDAADNEFNINKITLMEKNVQGGYSSINMTSTPHQENHSIELKTTNVLGSGTNGLKTSKITLSSNNTYDYSYIDVSADKLYLASATTISGSLDVSGATTLSATTISGSLDVSGETTISSGVKSCNIYPKTPDSYNLGLSNSKYNNVYTINLNASNISTTSISAISSSIGISVGNDITFNKNATFIGSSTVYLNGTMQPSSSSNTSKIGASGYPISIIYTKDIHTPEITMASRNSSFPLISADSAVLNNGFSPIMYGEIGSFSYYYSTTGKYTTEPGAIVYGWVHNNTSSTKTLHPGDIINSQSPGSSYDYTIYEASISESSLNISGRRWFSSYFRILSLVTVSGNSEAKALLMRVTMNSPVYTVITN